MRSLLVALALACVLAAPLARADEGMCSAPLPGESAEAAPPAGSQCSAPPAPVPTPNDVAQSTLERVRARGHLLCAHCDDTLGHSMVTSNWTASGMEPELCRGLAATLGVRPSYWKMRTPAERFPLLHHREVDIAFALTSKTVQRDMFERGSFSIPYFNDQHNLMVRSDAGIAGPADLRGKRICVTAGTTNPNVFNDYLASIVTLIGGSVDAVQIETVADDTRALELMFDNVCHGFVNDHSVVAGYVSIAKPPAGVQYTLATWSGTPFARAPFSAVTLDGDAEFASIVDWFVNGLFLAEMYDVTLENVEEKLNDASLPGEAQRLLGAQKVGGHDLPFSMLRAIRAIGNYAQVYERNFGAFLPRTKANQLYQNGGAIFPGGFR